VSATVQLSRDRLLIGSLGGGLTLFDRKDSVFVSDFEIADLISGNIRCLFRDSDEKIWVSTDKALYRLNRTLVVDTVFPYNLS